MFPQTLNLGNPVVRSHPLNRGRVAWWLAVPNWMGGKTFPDLCALNPGTLVNMANANNGWRSTTRQGGLGSVLFDGSAGYIATPSRVGPQSAYSAAAWINPATTSGTYIIVDGYAFGDGSFTNGAYTQFFTSGGVFHARIHQVQDTTYIGRTTGASTVTAGWSRVLFTWSGGTTNAAITIYINGVRADSADDGAGSFSAPYSGVVPFWIGAQDSSGGAAFFAGRMDDIPIWSRALSAAEVKQDYDLSRRGYPGVLNYIPAQPFGLQAAGGATYAWWAQQQGGILGTGAAA
jgi:hypothetical protein